MPDRQYRADKDQHGEGRCVFNALITAVPLGRPMSKATQEYGDTVLKNDIKLKKKKKGKVQKGTMYENKSPNGKQWLLDYGRRLTKRGR